MAVPGELQTLLCGACSAGSLVKSNTIVGNGADAETLAREIEHGSRSLAANNFARASSKLAVEPHIAILAAAAVVVAMAIAACGSG